MVITAKRTYSSILIASLTIALFCLLYPVYVIRPFRHQGPRELELALALMRVRPYGLILCVAASSIALVLFWRSELGRRSRIAFSLGAVAVWVLAGLSQVNIYEIMFHPMGQPAFVAADRAKLDGDEKVLTINIQGAARAYPIRIIAYHHIVNDVVGGLPVVATY